MRKLFTTTGLLGCAVAAMAFGNFLKVVEDTYRYSPRSQAAKAKCTLCHTMNMGQRLNAYGKDLKRVLKGSKVLTPEALKKLDNWDSFGTGTTNGAALRAGKKPS